MDAQNSLPPQDTATPHGLSARTVPQPLPALSLPNILSAEYDPFVNYEPNPTSHYSHDAYTSQPSQGSIVSNDSSVAGTPCRSPDPVERYGHPYPRMATPTTRTKAEGVVDYARASAASQYPSPRSSHTVPTDSNSYACDIVNRSYLTELSSTTWSRSEYLPLEADHPPTGTGGLGSTLLPGGRRTRAQRSQKKPRKCTTKEDANFICEVEGCGKLFSRSYNYKAHKETHDEKREYPFPCTVPDCKKKFVRKTDLQRHNQSVHMKERNHGCDYCGRMFARKDTLRRHVPS
ncbi:hypothetical protein DL766_008802 [Monosporascus sp. MC13-8B]|uniref:C2H2-type domain-containing protein n=1 Tax=Monosporascus cannonballus TaxID=155416 RepID=A0ABY0H7F6_9PEZI|nr:hypothetical protein DL762_004686 [Monosporascus cannonballus]RYO98737.1 hypothetical protein DL763_001998 [Monosporascus cannonballus]RYP17848.1 hypothetical protein DL766_008802 [Monosporascus sp. MC13-8B]